MPSSLLWLPFLSFSHKYERVDVCVHTTICFAEYLIDTFYTSKKYKMKYEKYAVLELIDWFLKHIKIKLLVSGSLVWAYLSVLSLPVPYYIFPTHPPPPHQVSSPPPPEQDSGKRCGCVLRQVAERVVGFGGLVQPVGGGGPQQQQAPSHGPAGNAVIHYCRLSSNKIVAVPVVAPLLLVVCMPLKASVIRNRNSQATHNNYYSLKYIKKTLKRCS